MEQTFSHSCDVIIVNYNAGRLLTESVQSVLAQGALHVFVVDNDSHDESLAYLSASISDNRIRIIRNGNNLGFAAACNIGVRGSVAETLLFLNPDSVLAPGSLRRMIEVLESTPSIDMVGGLLCNPDGSEQPGGRRLFPTPRRAFIRAFGLSHLSKWFPSLFSDFLLHKDKSWSCTLPTRTALLLVATFIVACGIVFDFLKETLGKSSSLSLFAPRFTHVSHRGAHEKGFTSNFACFLWRVDGWRVSVVAVFYFGFFRGADGFVDESVW